MADDDEVGDGIAFDPTFATAGPRRSTFTPPTGGVSPVPETQPQLDDDALADALAADLSRINTGTVAAAPPPFAPRAVAPSGQYPAPEVPEPEAPAPETPAPDVPAPETPAPQAPAPQAPAEPTPVPPLSPAEEPLPAPHAVPPASPAPPERPAAPEPPGPPSSPGLPPVAPEAPAPPAFPAPPATPAPPAPAAPFVSPVPSAPYPSVPPTGVAPPAPSAAGASAPWSSFPAPDPAQAVPLPNRPDPLVPPVPTDDGVTGQPQAAQPERSSTLDMIERLQAQLELRDREARERAESSERSAGADAPAGETGAAVGPTAAIPPVPVTEPFVDREGPVAAWPVPDFRDDAVPSATVPPAAPAQEPPVAAQPAPPAEEPEAVPEPTSPGSPETDTSTAGSPTPEAERPLAPWEQPLPNWAAPDAEARISEPLVAETPPVRYAPWQEKAPMTDASQAPEPEPEESAPGLVSVTEPVAPGPPLPAWEIPAPGPNWSPGPEFGTDAEAGAHPGGADRADEGPAGDAPQNTPPVATASPAAEQPPAAPAAASFAPAPSAYSAWEPQPWDRISREADVVPEAAPAQEPDAAPEPAPEPPPLVEPILHGPPLLPSQAAGRPPIATPEFGAPPTAPPVDLPSPVGPAPAETASAEPASAEPAPVYAAPSTPPPPAPEAELPPLVEPGGSEANWAAPTGVPLAPAAGDTLEGPTLDAGAVADAVASAAASTPFAPPAARQFSFDDLLAAEVPLDEEPQLYRDPEPATAADAAPEAIFIEPMPVAAGEPVPTDTGSISVIDQAYEEELPDDVDETDRAIPRLGAVSVDTAGVAVVTGAVHPPSGPIATVRVPEDEVVLVSNEPVRMRVFSLEDSGLEATPVDQRVGRSARLFWLWFASNSSIVSLGLGASVFAVGMSLRQSVVSVLAGVALSFIPLGLTTLAGKRSGQPTMVVSRATFGLLGNILPAILALLTRVFWGAVLLWLLASSVAIILVGAALDGGLGDRQLLLISLAVAFLVALLVAFAGYPLFARIQLILSIVSALLVVGLIAMTWKYVDFAAALTTPDGPWALTISGAVLVFSFVGLVWANSGADLARYQRPGTSGAASMLWATVGTTLPTFILIAYGALLAASDKGIAKGFLGSPLDTLSLMLPNWYPIPLLAATGLSLLSGIILTLYSGGFALQAIGVRVRRQWSIVIVAVLLGGLALLLTFGVTGGMNELFRDAATTLAVPTAAWAGIFAAETMIRNRRYESQSLVTRGGIYADVRWLNLIALVVISAIGYGLTTATISWLDWQGYGFTLLGMPLDSDLAASDVGVLVALVLGLLVPLVAGVPAIRRQEALRPTS
ncbi:hypothetical protein BH11ACT4_BH11ACT4_04790 [soil metagenome]